MAFIYEARDGRLNRTVALKVLAPELASEPDFRERFLRESRFAASLDHPNIVPIYEAGEADGLLYIAMRYVRGTNLDALLRQGGRLDREHAISILAPVADALDTAHDAGLIHRDVKPANILLGTFSGRDGHEHVYLTDFGVTKRTSALTKLTATGNVVGTMAYASPEQIRGDPVDSRADLYAFGCVAYECLTGVPPFVRDDQAALLWAHLSERPTPVSQYWPDLAAADAIMGRALAKQPADRYQTCEQFVSDLARAMREHDGQAAPDEVGPAATVTSSLPTQVSPPVVRIVHNGPDPAKDPSPADLAPTVRKRAGADPVLPVASQGGKRVSYRKRVIWLASAAVALVALLTTLVRPGEGQADKATAVQTTSERSSPTANTFTASNTVHTVNPPLIAPSVPVPGGATTGSTPPSSHATPVRPSTTSVSQQAPASSIRPLPAQAVPATLGKPVVVHGQPGSLTIAPNGRLAYFADAATDRVGVIDTNINQLIASIPISEGPPRYITFAPNGLRAYVSIYDDTKTVNVVAVLDTRTVTEIGHFAVDRAPYALSVTPDGRFLYVPSHDTATLDVIDLAKGNIVRRIHVPPNPHWVAFSADGSRAYIADHESNVLTVLDVATGRIITQIKVGTSPHSVAISPDGSRVVVVCYDSNDLYVVSTKTRKVLGHVPVGDNPRDVVYSPDGHYLYIANETGNSVSVVANDQIRVTATIPTPAPISIAVTADGRKAYVTNSTVGTITILATA